MNTQRQGFFVRVPKDWSKEKDAAYYRDWYGQGDFLDDARRRVAANYHIFGQLLTAGIGFFRQAEHKALELWNELPIETRMDELRLLIRAHPPASGELERFAEDLENGGTVVAEHSRLLESHVRNPGTVSIHEFVTLSDCIVTAQMNLDESLACEYEEFQSYRDRFFPDLNTSLYSVQKLLAAQSGLA